MLIKVKRRISHHRASSPAFRNQPEKNNSTVAVAILLEELKQLYKNIHTTAANNVSSGQRYAVKDLKKEMVNGTNSFKSLVYVT